MRLTMQNLVNCFEGAKKMGAAFVGVLVELPEGYQEVIINQKENFDAKLAYYKAAYNDDLTHKHASGVKIVGFTYANSFAGIQGDFEISAGE